MAGPRTETERELAEIWKELLKVEEAATERPFIHRRGTRSPSWRNDPHFFGTEDRFLEFEVKIFAKIGSALSPAAAAASLRECVPKSEDVAENVSEVLEDRGIESAGRSAAAQSRVSKAIV